MKNYKTEILKEKKYIIVCLILWLIFCISLIISYKTEWATMMNQPHIVSKVGDKGTGESVVLKDNDELTQKIELKDTEMTAFALNFNAGNAEKCLIKVELIDEKNGECLQSWENDICGIESGNYYNFVLKDTDQIAPNNNYIIKIKVLETDGQPARIDLYDAEKSNSMLCYNKQAMKGIISYKIGNGIHLAIKAYAVLLFAGSILCFAGMMIGVLKKRKIEELFVISALIVGIMYIFTITPFSVPDEARHFVTAYSQSSSVIGQQALDMDGNVISNSMLWEQGMDPTRDSYVDTVHGLTGNCKDGKTISTIPPLNGPYYLAYIPQIIGLVCARIAGLNFIQVIYAGRLSALLIYCLVMYWAIKIIPYKKSMLFIIGMLPITLQQVMSYSYDSTLIDVTFLMIAVLLNKLADKNHGMSKKMWLLFVVSMVIVASIKFVYLPIWGLILFVSLKNKNDNIQKYSACAVGGIISLAVIIFGRTKTLKSAMQIGGATASITAKNVSLGYCLANPIWSIEVVWRTLERVSSEYLGQLIGTSLGRLNISIPTVILVGFILIFLISTLEVKNEYIPISKNVKYWSVFCIIIIGGLVLLSMFWSWTPISANVIQGVQGRYFLPALPLVGIVINNKMIVLEKKVDKYLMIVSLFLNCYTLYFVMLSAIVREVI